MSTRRPREHARHALAAAIFLVSSTSACGTVPPDTGVSTVVASSQVSGAPASAPANAPTPVATAPGPPVVSRSTAKCGTDPVETGGWVEVPAATYTMGKVTDRARLARHVKKPDDVITSLVFLDPVRAKVDRFWIGRAEVTVGEYAKCVAAGACTAPPQGEDCGGGPDFPVNCVSFHQAARYCDAIGARLPTEPEWELAARGTEGRLFAWGDTPDEAAFFGPRHPVGSCRIRDTPTGVHDLAGNGREWTSTGDEQTRVSKGMACDGELACYAFNRFVNQRVEEQLDYLGFRCARSDGPGPENLAFAGRPAATVPPAPRRVHWSTLIDSFVGTRGPVARDTICFVDVAFDGAGRATSARAVDVARPDQPACPPALRPLAEKTARTVKVGAHEGGVETTLPVRITK